MADNILDDVRTKLSYTDKVYQDEEKKNNSASVDDEPVIYNDHPSNYSNLDKFTSDIQNLTIEELTALLDFACGKCLHEHAKKLLEQGANPNVQQGMEGRKQKHPVLKAANQGFHEVLQVMKEDGKTDFSVIYDGETILHYILRRKKVGQDTKNGCGYRACLDIILDKNSEKMRGNIKEIINKQDPDGYTGLHYATDLWAQDVVHKLLEFGAHIGIKNKWQEIPISKIIPETMREFLDSESCLSYENDVCQEDFNLTFHYDFLAPDKHLLPKPLLENYDDNQTKFVGIQNQSVNILNRGKEELTRKKASNLALPETEGLWYMGKSKEHRYLLKHPVITSFLWFKWKRIRNIFNRNLRIYAVFVFLLTWYIFENFGSKSSNQQTKNWYHFFMLFTALIVGFICRDLIIDINDLKINERPRRQSSFASLVSYVIDFLLVVFLITVSVTASFCSEIDEETKKTSSFKISYILKLALIAEIIFLSLREFLQLLVSLKRYITSLENWLEITLIILVSILLSNIWQLEANRHVAAIIIVISWAELIITVGKHPKLNRLNIYVTMFFKVLKDFTLFLVWYSIFIISFGLGFYIILHKPESSTHATKVNDGERSLLKCSGGTVVEIDNRIQINQVLRCPDGTQLEIKTPDDYDFFNKNWLALVKTSTMFTGELEFGDIPINRNSYLAPLSYVFFLVFVLLVVVVLMNLLTGLAVGEIGKIRNKAEIYSCLSQVETISYIESMMLGDPFDFLKNVPKSLSRLDSCSFCRLLYRFDITKRIFNNIGSGILLFYDFLPEKMVTIFPNKKKEGCGHSLICYIGTCACFRRGDVGADIVTSAKNIILRKTREAIEKKKKEIQIEKEEYEIEVKSKRLTSIENQLKEIKNEKYLLLEQLMQIKSLIRNSNNSY